MKTLKILSSAFVLMLALTVSFQSIASDLTLKNDYITTQTDPNKTEIDPAKLPAAVQDAIEDGDYSEWKISKAYEITFEEKPEKVEYEVHFKNAKKQKAVEHYTKDGEEIDEG